MSVTYDITLQVENQGSTSIGQQLDSLVVASGSSDGFSQPSPATCSLSFIGSPSIGGLDQSPAWWLGRRVGILMTPSDGAEQPIFYGRVYGVNSSPISSTNDELLITLMLQSPMADMSQYLVTSNLPAQTETVRLNALNDDAKDISWLEVATNITWNDVEATRTWAQYIDQNMPSLSWDLNTIHDMIPYVADNSTFMDVLTELAMGTGSFIGDYLSMNASGINYLLWYTFAGNYSDIATSSIDLATSAIFDGLQSNMSLADIYNYVEATNGTETRSFSVPSSIESYSLRELSLNTQFSSPNDIDTLVANKATGQSNPVPSLSQVTIDYDVIADSKRINYVGKNKNINFTNVPANFGGDQPYTVRGMELSVSYYHAEATWNVVPQSVLAYFTAWWLLNATDTWATYATATTKWSDLT